MNNSKYKTTMTVLSVGDACLIARMRLVLATSMLLTMIIDAPGDGPADQTGLISFGAYVAHAVILLVCTELGKPVFKRKAVHWLDMCWFALIVNLTGGALSSFFFCFYFSILTTSLRWGFAEGARITIVATAILVVSGLFSISSTNVSHLLLRATFLLATGYMSAYWGESKIALMRRLHLLRDVTHLSNPRFGIDQTINSVLGKIGDFFEARGCVLVLSNAEADTYSLRILKGAKQSGPIVSQTIEAEVATPLLALPPGNVVFHSSARRPILLFPAQTYGQDRRTNKWHKLDGNECNQIADLLEAGSYISTPVSLMHGTGRLYVTGERTQLSKTDAVFLSHIVDQTFPVLDNIGLVDRMASAAASVERHKIALDLHDTAVQPYIGLTLALYALRNKSSSDNPLAEDIDKLLAMTTQVVGELRKYGRQVRETSVNSKAAFLISLQEQAAYIKGLYGIDVDVSMEGELQVSDRLAAEALQVVREGLHNIGKHTAARRGSVALCCRNGRLNIKIGNESAARLPTDFTPRSITERAAVLGGQVKVQRAYSGHTVVEVEIPV